MTIDPKKTTPSANIATERSMLLLDEVEKLSWAWLDEQIDDAELERLEHLLATHAEARERHLCCVQMHLNLAEHFAVEPSDATNAANGILPVLGFLGEPIPPVNMPPTESQ
jgi:hypothetical protein